MKAILAKKIEMTHIFDEAGNFVPVTLLWAEGNVVTQVKTADKDGYDAVQIGFGKAKNLAKPQVGHLKKSKEVKHLREFTAEDGQTYQVGEEVKVDIFAEGERVTVQSTSKGKGFAGTIRRHNFHRGPKTHGSHNYRAPGSIGAMFPQHVVKGTKLPGRTGGVTVKVKNQMIARIMPEDNLILLRGAVPGPKKSLVMITAAGTAKKTQEVSEKE
jgi:large subunit ribosomal protein L3